MHRRALQHALERQRLVRLRLLVLGKLLDLFIEEPVEIAAKSGVYDYAARYTAGFTTFHCPARLEPAVAKSVADLAIRAHTVLGLRDVSRMDAIVPADGPVQFL